LSFTQESIFICTPGPIRPHPKLGIGDIPLPISSAMIHSQRKNVDLNIDH
jgi:hypothetical protein